MFNYLKLNILNIFFSFIIFLYILFAFFLHIYYIKYYIIMLKFIIILLQIIYISYFLYYLYIFYQIYFINYKLKQISYFLVFILVLIYFFFFSENNYVLAAGSGSKVASSFIFEPVKNVSKFQNPSFEMNALSENEQVFFENQLNTTIFQTYQSSINFARNQYGFLPSHFNLEMHEHYQSCLSVALITKMQLCNQKFYSPDIDLQNLRLINLPCPRSLPLEMTDFSTKYSKIEVEHLINNPSDIPIDLIKFYFENKYSPDSLLLDDKSGQIVLTTQNKNIFNYSERQLVRLFAHFRHYDSMANILSLNINTSKVSPEFLDKYVKSISKLSQNYSLCGHVTDYSFLNYINIVDPIFLKQFQTNIILGHEIAISNQDFFDGFVNRRLVSIKNDADTIVLALVKYDELKLYIENIDLNSEDRNLFFKKLYYTNPIFIYNYDVVISAWNNNIIELIKLGDINKLEKFFIIENNISNNLDNNILNDLIIEKNNINLIEWNKNNKE